MEQGKIIEQGTHVDLLKRKGRYYDLYMKQFQEKIESKIDLLAD
jgi:ATP-binding cassette subfamily B protein